MSKLTLEELSDYVYDKMRDSLPLPLLGKVYRSTYTLTQQAFLLKMLPDNRVLTPELVLEELPMLQSLTHPNLVQYFNVFVEYVEDKHVGEVEENYVYVLEYAPFRSLADFPTTHFWEEGLKTVLLHTLEALRYLHNQNVIHAHLQPAQVLLIDTPNEISAKLFYASKAMRMSEEFLHLYEYQAPEQLLGKQSQVGIATDIWAFGVMLYEILTQETPFGSEKQGFTIQDLLQHMAQHPTPALLHTLLQPYQYIVWKCLQIKPKERFNNVNEILFLLRNPDVVSDIPPTETPLKSFKGIQKVVEPTFEMPEVPNRKPNHSYTGLLWLLLVLLVGSCVFITIVFMIDNGQTLQKYYDHLVQFLKNLKV